MTSTDHGQARQATDAPAVSASALAVSYDGLLALRRSDFTIPSGALTAVIGPNGSGKSTLLHAIAGLVETRHGTLEVLGGRPAERHDRVAYVLQTTRVNDVLPVTVREVVTMGVYGRRGFLGRLTPGDRDEVDAVLERLRIADVARRNMRDLSAGQRQRVFVAQGLVQRGELLLLDEPLTAMDILSHEIIDDELEQEVRGGTTVVLTTHDLDEARRADHVLLLGGRVVAEGPPDQVLTEEALAEAYGAQLLHAGEDFALDDPHHGHEPPQRSPGHRVP